MLLGLRTKSLKVSAMVTCESKHLHMANASRVLPGVCDLQAFLQRV